MKLLLQRKELDLNAAGRRGGGTPLHRGAMWGSAELVKLLLQCPELDPNQQDRVPSPPAPAPAAVARDERRETLARLLAPPH